MAKEDAIYFLSEESLEALESSKGAIILIKYPKLIEENNEKITKLEQERTLWVGMIEVEQKAVDDYAKLPWIKRISKKCKVEKDAHVLNLGNFAKDVAKIDSEIGELMMQNRDMKFEYDIFVSALGNVNVEPQDVIDEYSRIKDILERKARGEYVEEQPTETPVVVETETPVVSEVAAEVVSAPALEGAIPSQNLKSKPKLTQREKFERRLALTAQKTAKLDTTCKNKQPGEN